MTMLTALFESIQEPLLIAELAAAIIGKQRSDHGRQQGRCSETLSSMPSQLSKVAVRQLLR